jgi:hypothetical protein
VAVFWQYIILKTIDMTNFGKKEKRGIFVAKRLEPMSGFEPLT